MSEHNEQYRKETRGLPINKQIEVLKVGWEHAVDGQREMGFGDTTIVKGLAAFLISLFPARGQAADFFAALSMDLRSEDEQERRQGPQTVN